ncbi:MAG TPA: hypothetical protein PKA98_01550 [Acidimicrobiales bacterium]|nr:hypothetical protein [Acidimicrobiales bacterium]
MTEPTAEAEELGARLVPLAAYLERLAGGYALVAALVVPEGLLLWAAQDPGERAGIPVFLAQFLALPAAAAVVAVLGGRGRDRRRERIYAGLPDVTGEHPEDLEVVDDADGLRRAVRRAVIPVFVIWFVLGLVLSFMGSTIVALALYAWIVARTEAAATRRDGRELLTRPRWFVWLPVAWRTVPATGPG